MNPDQQILPTTSIYSGWLMAIASALIKKGANPETVFSRAGMDYKVLSKDEKSSPLVATTRLWKESVLETNDEAFGLTVSSCIHATTFHALGFRFQCCSTPLDMLSTLINYQRLISNVVNFKLEESKGTTTLICSPSIPQLPSAAEAFDATTALIIRSVRAIAINKPQAQEVTLTRKPPSDKNLYDKIFKCSTNYNASINSVTWNTNDLLSAIPSFNEKLSKQLDQLLTSEIRSQNEFNISTQVEALLMELLPYGEPSQNKVAKQLNMSLRTLQRKLEKEETNYQLILENIRHHLALQYLPILRIPIFEISGLLGFKDQSSFTRWFKSNFHESPSNYRR